MKKALLFLFTIASLTASAKTRITYGPEVGVNVSNYYGEFSGIRQHFSTSIPGVRLGGVVDFSMTKNFSIQPGLCYARNGYNLVAIGLAGYTYTINLRISTVELPINFLYTIQRKDGARIFIGAGPYFAANVGGRVKSDYPLANREALFIGSSISDDIKRYDIGAGISAGYKLPGNLFIHLHYQHGLANLLPGGNADNTMQNVNYGVALGYLFGKHYSEPKKKQPYKGKR